jgi:hypothetical protein
VTANALGDTINPNLTGDAAKAAATRPYPWIISENFDFFLICGGAVWILMALNYIMLGWSVPLSVTQGPTVSRWLLVMILIGQHLSADAHNAATYMRIYGSDEDRQRFHFYGKWFAIACLPIFLLGITVPGLAGVMVYLYLITVFWHYAAQAFGIALIYFYKQDYKLKAIEREVFRWFILSMSALMGLRLLTFKDNSPSNFFGVPMPFWGPLPLWLYKSVETIFIGLSAAFALIILKKFFKERKMVPWPAALCISTLAMLGFSRGTVNALAWFYVPVFFHGSQYIAICLAYYLKERGLPHGMAASELASMLLKPLALKYFVTIVFVGGFLYIVIPHFFQSLGFDYSIVAGVVLATVNFHHFNTDAAIWRLRDARCREILLA